MDKYDKNKESVGPSTMIYKDLTKGSPTIDGMSPYRTKYTGDA